MAFVKSASNNSEELFVIEDSMKTTMLGKINIDTLILTPVGNYTNMSVFAYLAGTKNSKLYGAYEDTSLVINQINTLNANTLSTNSFSYSTIGSDPLIGFVSYNETFLLFTSNFTSTNVFTVDLSANKTTQLQTISQTYIALGGSSCLGT
jgi:hypothetical protein